MKVLATRLIRLAEMCLFPTQSSLWERIPLWDAWPDACDVVGQVSTLSRSKSVRRLRTVVAWARRWSRACNGLHLKIAKPHSPNSDPVDLRR